MHERELLTKKARVRRGLAPQGSDGAEVGRRGDERDSNRIPAPGGVLQQRGQLRPLGGCRAGVLGQEQRLRREHIGRRIAVGARRRGVPGPDERDQRRNQGGPRPGAALGGVRTVRQLPMKLVGTRKFMTGRRQAFVVLAALLALAAVPPAAAAHGPIAPISSSYLAKPAQVPAGLDAKTVDGDQRMWLRVPAAQTVVVLDYRGAPYLRFSPAGVEDDDRLGGRHPQPHPLIAVDGLGVQPRRDLGGLGQIARRDRRDRTVCPAAGGTAASASSVASTTTAGRRPAINLRVPTWFIGC